MTTIPTNALNSATTTDSTVKAYLLGPACTHVLGIDPGSERSAYVGINRLHGSVVVHGILDNGELLALLRAGSLTRELGGTAGTMVVIEQMRGFMQRVGLEVFETCRWAGRFEEACEARGALVTLLGRKDVVVNLTGSANPKGADVAIRGSLIDRYGGAGGKAAAIGLKATPGPLYGLARDEWSALALAVTWIDREGQA